MLYGHKTGGFHGAPACQRDGLLCCPGEALEGCELSCSMCAYLKVV